MKFVLLHSGSTNEANPCASFHGITATGYTGTLYLFLITLPGLKVNFKMCREQSGFFFYGQEDYPVFKEAIVNNK